MFRSEYVLRQQAAARDGRSKVGDDARKARLFDLGRGAARCGWSAEHYVSLIVVVLALIVAASSWAAGDSTERSWRHTWLVATTHVARLPDAVRQELCPYGLIDYFRNHPAFAPEWFRAACAPLVVGGDWHGALSPLWGPRSVRTSTVKSAAPISTAMALELRQR